MLPENQTPAFRPEQLFFCYNRQQDDILYTNIPFPIFFGSGTAAEGFPVFLHQQWKEAMQLKPGESSFFSFAGAGGNEYFSCHITAPEMQAGKAFQPLLMCSVMRSNKALTPLITDQFEEFIHLAAHDLDAPLRKINLLTERLAAKIGPDSDGSEIISRITANIKDMRSIIDGVARLANANISGEPGQLDPGELLAEQLTSVRKKYPQKEIIVELGSLPVLYGSAAAYRELFHELIENAVVFAGSDRVLISVFAEAATGEEKAALSLENGIKFYKITFRDTGIGFRQEDAGKIFQPFVRLHGKSAYPGSGLGLAICKKIVENHHGVIYAESAENEGARFILFLPQSLS